MLYFDPDFITANMMEWMLKSPAMDDDGGNAAIAYVFYGDDGVPPITRDVVMPPQPNRVARLNRPAGPEAYNWDGGDYDDPRNPLS